jgi:hypothetical protein
LWQAEDDNFDSDKNYGGEIMNYSRDAFVIFATIFPARVWRRKFRCELNVAIHCGRA